MLLKIYDKNPSERALDEVVSALERGGVVIYPTDSVYAFGCFFAERPAGSRPCAG